MRKIMLRFPDAESLQQFASVIKDIYFQINVKELIVACNCEEAEVELAINGFKAVLML